MVSDEYLAGLFDGEGTIGVYVSGRSDGLSTRVTVRVAMYDEQPIAALYARFGGTKTRYRASSTGHIVHNWYVCGTRAREALEVFANLCLNKAPQARLALEALSLIERSKTQRKPKVRLEECEVKRRYEIAAEIKQLKKAV